jgi:MraZ protein
MSTFIGTDTYSIDHKGRITVPLTMRRSGTGKPLTRFVLNRGLDGCVAVRSVEEWNRAMQRMRRVNDGEASGRAFIRAFMMHAKEVTVDAQGRIPIPPALIGHAGIGKEAVLHGAGTHLEIWDPERFRQQVSEITEKPGEYERLAALHLKGEDS